MNQDAIRAIAEGIRDKARSWAKDPKGKRSATQPTGEVAREQDRQLTLDAERFELLADRLDDLCHLLAMPEPEPKPKDGREHWGKEPKIYKSEKPMNPLDKLVTPPSMREIDADLSEVE